MKILCVGGPLDGEWQNVSSRLAETIQHGETFALAVRERAPPTLAPIFPEGVQSVPMRVVHYQAQKWEIRRRDGYSREAIILHPADEDPTRTLDRLIRGYKRPPDR